MIAIALTLTLPARTPADSYTYEELVSAYIYLIAKNTEWPEPAGNGAFTIGVVETGDRLSRTLEQMLRGFRLHGRAIRVRSFATPRDLPFGGLQVLYVGRAFKDEVPALYRAIPPRMPLLLITHSVEDPRSIMVNIYYDSRHRSRIQINRANIYAHRLKISEKILLTGGEEVGVSKLFDASLAALKRQEARYQRLRKLNRAFEKEIATYKERVATLQHGIETMEKRLVSQRKKVRQKERELQLKEREIGRKEQRLQRLEDEYARLKEETLRQKEKLESRLDEIARQEREIARRSEILERKQRHIEALDRKIAEQNSTIARQSAIIATHQSLLEAQHIKIERQRVRLYLLLVIVALLLLFALYIYRNKRLLESLTQKLQKAKESAEYANRSKSTFLTNMSHELRTPLNAILGFSDLMLKDDTLSPAQKSRLGIIHRSGTFLLTLINDVLNLARVESGRITIEKEPVDVGLLIQDVVSLMEQRAETKGLEIRIDQSSQFPRCIVTDGDKVRQILLNYLSNAVKYTEKGEIVLRLDADENRLFMQVRDQGPGLTPGEQAKIFEPFVQVGEASERTGTGLGLSITREFAEALGGKVWVESAPGRGSTFFATIRYELCRGRDNDVVKKETRNEVIGLAPEHKGLKVLIVEDKEDNRILLRSLLEVLGVRVEEAKDGVEAVEIFRRWHPDFIWMDRRMPRLNGEEATKIIRSEPGGDKVVIVALTASAFADEREKVMAAGMDGFVVKPYDPAEIYETMGKFLGLRYIYREREKKKVKEEGGFSTEAYVEALETLEASQLDALQRAAVLLDQNEIEEVLAALPADRADLIETTRTLARRLEFPLIIEAIEKVRSGRNT